MYVTGNLLHVSIQHLYAYMIYSDYQSDRKIGSPIRPINCFTLLILLNRLHCFIALHYFIAFWASDAKNRVGDGWTGLDG